SPDETNIDDDKDNVIEDAIPAMISKVENENMADPPDNDN
ncbi:hypothetical protein TNCT_49351, partial [Trichonephila clavata]